MAQLDLERLRTVVLDSRRSGEARPRERRRQIFVDPSGRVLLGDDVGQDEGRQLSEVHQAVFAAPKD
ncbi:MAG TPA: hypothetical protein VEM76_08460 [Anaeromyxobacteraceae bacterium]|nr:hypothetical protein [Anaeromyxobacteraceae bacterium]